MAESRYKQNRLQQLRGFCHTVRAGSMSKAARIMGLTQPTVSLQVSALEDELGVELFERSGRNVVLTADGEILYELAIPLVGGMDQLDEEFHARRGGLDTGHIEIAAGGSTIQYLLPRYVQEFVQEHPAIDLHLNNVTGPTGLELLRTGAVDFAIGPMIDIPDDIDFRPVVTYEPMLITARKHPLARDKYMTLKDISQHPFILPPQQLTTRRQVEQVFTKHGLEIEVKLEVGGYDVIKEYVELGLGISIVMGHCLKPSDKLFRKSVRRYFPRRTYGIVLRKGGVLSPQARAFVELMTGKRKPET